MDDDAEEETEQVIISKNFQQKQDDDATVLGFIDDLIETIDAFLWVKRAIIPHEINDTDDLNDMSSVFTKKERDELFDEIFTSMNTWFDI